MSARRAAARVALGAEAAIALALATAAVRVLPARRQSRLLGQPGPAGAATGGVPDPRAKRVGRAVERVAGILPWRPSCLPQAIATRAMLRRRRIACEAHLGIVSTSPLAAHAWVTVEGHVVQGGPLRGATEVAALR
jgi:hypothetical protein